MKKNDENYLRPADVAQIMGTSPMMVRVSLKQGAPGWNFPYIMCGNRMKIPKTPFYEFFYGKPCTAQEITW